MLVYATAEDLYPVTRDLDLPVNVDLYLAAASRLVRAATRTAVYATTDTGLPVDAALADAMRDATVAQVAAWVTAGVNPVAGATGAPLTATSKAIGGASVSYAGADALAADRRALVDQLTPDATAILADAGLIGARPWVTG